VNWHQKENSKRKLRKEKKGLKTGKLRKSKVTFYWYTAIRPKFMTETAWLSRNFVKLVVSYPLGHEFEPRWRRFLNQSQVLDFLNNFKNCHWFRVNISNNGT
jgi:hypothetical protein